MLIIYEKLPIKVTVPLAIMATYFSILLPTHNVTKF